MHVIDHHGDFALFGRRRLADVHVSMIRWTIILAVGLSIVAPIGPHDSLLHARQATRPLASSIPDAKVAYRPKPGVAYQSFYVVEPITPRIARRFQSVLMLSPEQEAQFDLLFKQYRAQDEEVRKSDLPALWERAAAVAASSKSEGFESLLADAALVSNRIEATETMLFENVGLLLSPQQELSLDRVRRMRERQRAEVYGVAIPGAKEDLSAILYGVQLDLEIESLDPPVREQVESYESLATASWIQYARKLREKILLEQQLFGPAMTGRSPEQNQVAFDRFAASNQEQVRLEQRLKQINQQYLRNIGDLLPAEQRETLINRYNASAYPQVFPDPYDATPVLDCLSASRADDDPVRAAINSIRETYRTKVEAISKKMVDRHVEWTTHLHATRVRDDAGFVVFKKEMSELQAQRAKEADTVIQQAIAFVVAPTDKCAVAISNYRVKAAAHKPRVIGLTFRP